MGATTSTAVRPWQDLPPDVVREISDHLHTAIDLVRFHAVCKPWRSTFDRDRASRHPPSLLPWLVTPPAAAGDLECRCVFSRTRYRVPGIYVREDRRVACADGTAAWLVRGKDEDWLVNPLTATRLPISLGDSRRTNGWLDRTHRVVSGDGTFLVYGGLARCPRQRALHGLILKPGHEEWRPVELHTGSDSRRAVAYHDNVVVHCTLDYCYIVQPFRFQEAVVRLPNDPADKFCWRRYLVEFNGELMLVSVMYVMALVHGRVTCIWSLSLHALDLKAESSPAACVRDCDAVSLLRDHVLFLGFPSSFAIEAARFGREMSGGTAYFVAEPRVGQCCVYKHDFRVGKTTMMQELPRRWGDESCMWFLPQPDIAPIVTRWQQLTIYVGNLPPSMGHSRLREMFSKHGKVASAMIAYDKKGRSRGFGIVTMVTQKGFDRAMAALAVEEPEQGPRRGGTAGFSKLVVTIMILVFLSFAYYAFGRR